MFVLSGNRRYLTTNNLFTLNYQPLPTQIYRLDLSSHNLESQHTKTRCLYAEEVFHYRLTSYKLEGTQLVLKWVCLFQHSLNFE